MSKQKKTGGKKTLFYVVATTEGEFPAVPQKKPDACASQIPVCKKYRPDKNWKVFEIVQQTTVKDGTLQKEPPTVHGLAGEAGKRLMEAVFERHKDSKLLQW